MFAVVIPYAHNDYQNNQWSFVISNFMPDLVFVCGAPPDAMIIKGTTRIESVDEIRHLGEIVIATPENSVSVPGEIPLPEFTHPEHAVYVFGPDHRHLQIEDLEHAQIKTKIGHRVFIPTKTSHNMYSFVAGAVVFYDRMVKNG